MGIDPARRRPWQRISWPILALLLALSLIQSASELRSFLVWKPGKLTFFDFRVMREQLEKLEETGRLYDTSQPENFNPVTTDLFKYPPPHAVVLLALLDEEAPQTARGRQLFRIARPLVLFYVFCLIASLALILALFRPEARRALLLAAAFLSWQPHWESVGGPQIEPLLLLLFTVSLVCFEKGKEGLGGFPLGAAGALKVYPWALILYFALCRKWRIVSGIVLGAVATLAASAFVLPPAHSIEYLTQVLPRLGGISLSFENQSAFANLARFACLIKGNLPNSQQRVQEFMKLFQSSGPPGVHLLTWLVFAPLVLSLVLLTARALSRSTVRSRGRANAISFGLASSLMIFLIPTSWSNYQCLLALPLCVGIALAPARDFVTWGLLLCSAVLGAVPSQGTLLSPTVAKSLIPVALWLVHLRLLRSTESAPALS